MEMLEDRRALEDRSEATHADSELDIVLKDTHILKSIARCKITMFTLGNIDMRARKTSALRRQKRRWIQA